MAVRPDLKHESDVRPAYQSDDANVVITRGLLATPTRGKFADNVLQCTRDEGALAVDRRRQGICNNEDHAMCHWVTIVHCRVLFGQF